MESVEPKTDIRILGGGASSLCVGYFARKTGIPFVIHEKSSMVGGNAVTYQYGDFFYDSGAHRWHDKDPEMTKEVLGLLGERLKKIFVPSRIYHRGRFIDFPLSPLNLLMNLGPWHFSKAGGEVLKARLSGGPKDNSFEGFALHTYGRTIADRFLLNYSERLWGAPCRELSPNIAGKRMKGLSLKTFLKEAISGSKAKTEHLDGSFYYPDYGIGVIAECIANFCGRENIKTNSEVTRIFHNEQRITALELNGRNRVEAGHVVNSLPVNQFLKMMEPAPDSRIMALADSLRFRHMVLVALFLNHLPLTRSATVYFADPGYSFTRLYEPANRSPLMSPSGKTSLVVEIPCHFDDEVWSGDDTALIRSVRDQLTRIGWFSPEDVIGGECRRMQYAYPILENGVELKTQEIFRYLSRFENLSPAGRGGNFQYIHLHDMLRSGMEIIQGIRSGAKP